MKNGILIGMLLTLTAAADTFTFSTGNVTNSIAVASRPDTGGVLEKESADDFVTTGLTTINGATFTGLLTGTTPTIGEVTVEIYRVFPFDSSVPPSTTVPTRANSPSDVAFASRTSGAGLTFSTSVLSLTFTASNSVVNGINKVPNQNTLGEGPKTGQEVLFTINFTSPLSLPPDHYFFVPQVQVTNGDFLWLSGTRPIVAPGTPFNPDLQAWIRDGNLDPNWLRVGTDIVGGATPPTFNLAFTLSGTAVPEPGTLLLLGVGIGLLVISKRRWR